MKNLALASAGELCLASLEYGLVLRNGIRYLGGGQHVSRECVVQIGCVVGCLIGEIDELCFQRRPQARKVRVEFGILPRTEVSRMLDYALAHFESEIQAGKPRVALLELFDDAEGVEVVIELLAEARHLAIEFLLAGMGKGRMTDVVGQGERLSQVFVKLQN